MARGRIYRPIYTTDDGQKRESAVWWCDFSVNGERYRESTKKRDRREAERYLTRRLRELDVHGTDPEEFEDVTFTDLAKLIREDYERNDYRSSVENRIGHLQENFGDIPAMHIGDVQVDEYVSFRRRQGAKNSTINRELSVLRRMFNLGERARIVLPARVPNIDMLRENNVRTGFVEPGEFEALKRNVPDRLKPLLEFAYVTGWRKRELLSRDWKHVDREHGWIRLEPGETKNGEGRQFPLTDRLRAVVERQLERKEATEPKHDCTVDALFFYLEPSKNGMPAGRRIKSFRRAWDTARTKAGVPDRIFHDFRRTAARNLIRAGVPEKVAMELTGHQTRSDFDRYSIVSEGMLRGAGDRLDTLRERDEDAIRRAENGKVRQSESGKVSEAETS